MSDEENMDPTEESALEPAELSGEAFRSAQRRMRAEAKAAEIRSWAELRKQRHLEEKVKRDDAYAFSEMVNDAEKVRQRLEEEARVKKEAHDLVLAEEMKKQAEIDKEKNRLANIERNIEDALYMHAQEMDMYSHSASSESRPQSNTSTLFRAQTPLAQQPSRAQSPSSRAQSPATRQYTPWGKARGQTPGTAGQMTSITEVSKEAQRKKLKQQYKIVAAEEKRIRGLLENIKLQQKQNRTAEKDGSAARLESAEKYMTMTQEQKKAGIEKKGHEKMMKVLAHKKDMTCGKLEASVKEQQAIVDEKEKLWQKCKARMELATENYEIARRELVTVQTPEELEMDEKLRREVKKKEKIFIARKQESDEAAKKKRQVLSTFPKGGDRDHVREDAIAFYQKALMIKEQTEKEFNDAVYLLENGQAMRQKVKDDAAAVARKTEDTIHKELTAHRAVLDAETQKLTNLQEELEQERLPEDIKEAEIERLRILQEQGQIEQSLRLDKQNREAAAQTLRRIEIQGRDLAKEYQGIYDSQYKRVLTATRYLQEKLYQDDPNSRPTGALDAVPEDMAPGDVLSEPEEEEMEFDPLDELTVTLKSYQYTSFEDIGYATKMRLRAEKVTNEENMRKKKSADYLAGINNVDEEVKERRRILQEKRKVALEEKAQRDREMAEQRRVRMQRDNEQRAAAMHASLERAKKSRADDLAKQQGEKLGGEGATGRTGPVRVWAGAVRRERPMELVYSSQSSRPSKSRMGRRAVSTPPNLPPMSEHGPDVRPATHQGKDLPRLQQGLHANRRMSINEIHFHKNVRKQTSVQASFKSNTFKGGGAVTYGGTRYKEPRVVKGPMLFAPSSEAVHHTVNQPWRLQRTHGLQDVLSGGEWNSDMKSTMGSSLRQSAWSISALV